MKHLLLVTACLFIVLPSQVQNTDSLQVRLDSLYEVQSDLQLKLARVETGILDIEHVLARIEFERLSAEGIGIEIRRGAALRPDASPGGQIGFIPAGTTVRAAGMVGGYWYVHYEGRTGYVSDVFVLRTEQTRRFAEVAKQAEAAKRAETAPDQARPRAQPSPRPCCKICRTGKACGDSCIARNKTCRKGPGCACNG